MLDQYVASYPIYEMMADLQNCTFPARILSCRKARVSRMFNRSYDRILLINNH